MKKLCIALAAAALAPVAMAQQAGDIVARFRVVNIDPADKDSVVLPASLGGDVAVSVSKKTIPEVDFTYYFSPNLAAELILTVPQKHTVRVNGGDFGTVKHLPPTLTAQYHFTDLGAFKPYVGIGLNHTRFMSEKLTDPAGVTLTVDKTSWGLALQAGVDFAIDKTWSLNLDIKKVKISTDLMANGASVGTVKIDPLLVGVGVGYKF